MPHADVHASDLPADFEAPSFHRTVLRNLQSDRLHPATERQSLWAKVSYLFGLGSSSATAFCFASGFEATQTSERPSETKP